MVSLNENKLTNIFKNYVGTIIILNNKKHVYIFIFLIFNFYFYFFGIILFHSIILHLLSNNSKIK